MSEENIKFKNLLDKIYVSTKKSNVDWRIYENEKPYCFLGNYFIFLSSETNPEGEPLEFLTIRDTKGNVLDQFNDTDLSQFTPSYEEPNFPNYWTLMEHLRIMAMRKAKGADIAIDEIISALDDIDVPF